jgi:uncharacterized membrane protein YedE/YeeE
MSGASFYDLLDGLQVIKLPLVLGMAALPFISYVARPISCFVPHTSYRHQQAEGEIKIPDA